VLAGGCSPTGAPRRRVPQHLLPGWAKHAWSNLFAQWLAEACALVVNQSRFAGEPLNPEVIEQVRQAWGLTVRDGFGQTETTALVGNAPGQRIVPGSMGRPLPGYDVVRTDPVTGAVRQEPGAEGEICLRLDGADLGRPLGLMTSAAGSRTLGLGDRLLHRPHELSGGERRRVAIARAIVGKPALLLANEPTGNLDSASGAAVMAALHRLHQAGTTVIVITHDPEIAAALPRRLRMHDGRARSDEWTADSRAGSDEPATPGRTPVPGGCGPVPVTP
jgi:hypothetical protein